MEEIVTRNWYLRSFMAPHSTIHSNTVGIEALNLKLQGAGTKSCTQFDGTTSFFEISMLLVFTSMEIPRALSCKKAIKWSQTSE